LARNESLSFQFVKHFDGKVVFTLAVDEEIFPFVKNLLENGGSVIQWLMTQNRVDKATTKAHDPVEIAAQEERYIKRRDKILAKFDSFVSSGLAIRPAMMKTKAFFNNELTSYQIELMARETGRLSKKRKK
jgi:hypothetical protein